MLNHLAIRPAAKSLNWQPLQWHWTNRDLPAVQVGGVMTCFIMTGFNLYTFEVPSRHFCKAIEALLKDYHCIYIYMWLIILIVVHFQKHETAFYGLPQWQCGNAHLWWVAAGSTEKSTTRTMNPKNGKKYVSRGYPFPVSAESANSRAAPSEHVIIMAMTILGGNLYISMYP